MTQEEIDTRHTAFRDVVAEVQGGSTGALLQDLGNVILEISCRLARARRAVTEHSEVARDLHDLDDALAGAVNLTRKIRERVTARHRLCDLASLTQVACEIAAMIGPVMPGTSSLAVTYPRDPCIVAGSHRDLRRSLVEIVAAAVDSSRGHGQIRLTIGCNRDAHADRGGIVRVVLALSSGSVSAAEASWAPVVSLAQELAISMGASFDTVQQDGVTAISLTCPLVC